LISEDGAVAFKQWRHKQSDEAVRAVGAVIREGLGEQSVNIFSRIEVLRLVRSAHFRGKTMIQIQLRPEIEAQLAAEAQDHGLSLDRYIEKIVSGRTVTRFRRYSVGQAIDRIRELRKGNMLGGLKIKDLIHEGHRY